MSMAFLQTVQLSSKPSVSSALINSCTPLKKASLPKKFYIIVLTCQGPSVVSYIIMRVDRAEQTTRIQSYQSEVESAQFSAMTCWLWPRSSHRICRIGVERALRLGPQSSAKNLNKLIEFRMLLKSLSAILTVTTFWLIQVISMFSFAPSAACIPSEKSVRAIRISSTRAKY